MAVVGIFDNNMTKPKPKSGNASLFSTFGNNLNSGLFSNIKSGESKTGDLVTGNVNNMLSGDSYDAYKSQANQKMSRAIANLRNSVGNQYGKSVGQGSYDRAQQGMQQSIFTQLADNNLNAEVEKQGMKERGIAAAQNIAQGEATNRQNNMNTAMQADNAYGYTDSLGKQIRGSNELAGEQADIQRMQAQTTKDLGYAGLGIENRKLDETARQFNISNETDRQQFGETLKKDYASLSQQEKQFLLGYGLDQNKFEQAKAEFSTTSAIQREQIASQQMVALKQVGVDEARLSETARQFNISTDQAAQQFNSTLQKDYFQLSQQEKQFLSSLGLDQAKFEQAKTEFNTQATIQREQLASTEKVAMANLNMDQTRLNETARQFNISTEQVSQQFAQSLQKDYASLSMQEKQFVQSLGLDQAKFDESRNQFRQNIDLENTRLASNEKIATSQLNLDSQKLSETARQFNISTQQVADQFTKKLNFDYNSLSQQDKQYLTSLGFDREKFDQSKNEFEKTFSLQNRIQTKDLDIKEKALAQEGSQFNSRLDFDKWATEAGLDDAAANRVWQAKQNDKSIEANMEVQKMLNATEEWKKSWDVALTQQGWDKEAIQTELNRQQTLTIAEMQNATEMEIAKGNISLGERQLLENARQFNTEADWQKAAKSMDVSEAAAQRIWATNERISSNAFNASQATFQSQVQKELASGTWTDQYGRTVSSVEAQGLIQEASQYQDQREWIERAKDLDLNQAEVQRVWETKERVDKQVFQAQQQEVLNELSLKGIKYQTVMSYLETMDGEQAGDIMDAVAKDAGITYVVKDAKGNPLTKKDEFGKTVPVTEKGFPPSTSTKEQKGFDLIRQVETGEFNVDDLRRGANPDSPYHQDYKSLLNTADVWKPDLGYNSGGVFKADSRTINNAPKLNSLIKYGDKIYQVRSYPMMNKSGQNSDEMVFMDVNTGENKMVKVEGKGGKNLKLTGL